MKSDLISVIVPVYNAEKYLEKCINSVINQTYRNLEIIFVNDGSEDLSYNILKKYAEKDERIIILDKEHGGQSSARNFGVNKSSGEFITFVDSDDWVDENIYNEVMKIFQKYNCDIVDFNGISVDDYSKVKKNKKRNNYKITKIENENILIDFLLKGLNDFMPFSVCKKVYKRKLFRDISFPENLINEDILTNFNILSKATSLIHYNRIGYYYYQRFNSTTRGGLKCKDFDLLKVTNQILSLSKEKDIKTLIYLAEIKYIRSHYSILAKILYYGVEDKNLNKQSLIKNLSKKLKKNYRVILKSPMKIKTKTMILVVSFFPNIINKMLQVINYIKRKGKVK